MANIKPEDLGNALNNELKLMAKDIQERCNKAGETAMKKLVKQTKATAPKGAGKGGHFKDSITFKRQINGLGDITHIWCVNAPDYRLTHLLVNGHQTRNGGRTKADPFLQNALNEILPQYEKEIEEAIK